MIKHGFGGIGDNARTMVKIYAHIKQLLPEAEEEPVLFLTLKTRRDHIKKLIKPINKHCLLTEQMKNDAKSANGNLSKLIFQELHYEYPILEEISVKDPNLYSEAEKIVNEIVEEGV